MAADSSYKLLATTYTFIVLITVVYILFAISRVFCAERNHWEIWVIYPIAYIFCLVISITCICKCLMTTYISKSTHLRASVFVELADGGRHMLYVLATNPKQGGTMAQNPDRR